MADGTRTVKIKFDGSTKGLDAAALKGAADVKAMQAGLERFQASATAASAKVQAAHDSVANATGKLRVAELQLQELQASGVAKASQLAAAEEKVAAARRGLNGATTQLRTAQTELGKAESKVTTAHGSLSNATVRVRTEMEKLKRQGDDHSTMWEKLSAKIQTGAQSLLTGAASMGRFLATGALALSSIGGIVQLVAQLSGVLGLLPGAGLAAVAVMLTMKLGFQGINRALNPLIPQLDALKAKVDATFQKGLAPAVSNLNGLMAKLAPGFVGIAQAISGVAVQFTALAKKASVVADLKAILADTATVVRNLGAAVAPVAEALIRIGRIGLEALTPFTSKIADAANRFRDFVTSAQGAQKIQGWIAGGISGFGDLKDAVVLILQHLDDLWHIAKPIFDALQPLIEPVIDVLIRVADAVGKALTPAVQAAEPFIEDLVKQLGGSLIDALNQIAPMLPGLIRVFGAILEGITPLVTQVALPTLVQLVRAFITGLIAITPAALIFLAALTPLIGAVAAFLTLLTGNAPAAWQIMEGSFRASSQTMRIATDTDWGAMLQSVNSNLTGMGDAVRGGTHSMSGDMSAGMAGMVGGVRSGMGDANGAVSSGVGGLIAGAQAGIPGMSAAGGGLGGAVAGAVRGIDWNGVGSQIVGGIKAGIQGSAPNLFSFARGFVDSLKSVFSVGLVIHSPSRWMRDNIGKNIVAGIGEGLHAYAPLATAPADSVVTQIQATTTAAAAASTGLGGPGVPEVRVFIGDQELRDLVRVEIGSSNRDTVRRLTTGAGAAR